MRNLPFDIKETHLQKDFKKYGTILNVHIPLKNETNLNRGFGFIEYETRELALKAVKEMNGKLYKGRKVEVQFSLP